MHYFNYILCRDEPSEHKPAWYLTSALDFCTGSALGSALGKRVPHWEILAREARFIVFMHTCAHESNVLQRRGVSHWESAVICTRPAVRSFAGLLRGALQACCEVLCRPAVRPSVSLL